MSTNAMLNKTNHHLLITKSNTSSKEYW